MNSHVLNGIVAFLAFSIAVSAYAAGDLAKGKTTYEICAVCHGADGEGTPELNVPKIGGWGVNVSRVVGANPRRCKAAKSSDAGPTDDVTEVQMKLKTKTDGIYF